jgi:hypothetical protein
MEGSFDSAEGSGFLKRHLDDPKLGGVNKAVIKTSSKPARLYFGFSPYTSANLVDKEGVPIPAFILPVQ